LRDESFLAVFAIKILLRIHDLVEGYSFWTFLVKLRASRAAAPRTAYLERIDDSHVCCAPETR